MAANTNLTRELALMLIRGKGVTCPNCEKEVLASRWGHKNQNVEYKCPVCGEIYRPCKLI